MTDSPGATQTSMSAERTGHEPPDVDRSGRLRRSVLLTAAIGLPIVFVAFAVSLFWGRGVGVDSARVGPADFTAKGAPEARPAPAFTLPLLSGQGSVWLADFSGKPLVLNLWASWCGPCRQEAPVLEGLWHRYGPLGVQFLGVDHLDARTAGLAFQRQFGITYRSAFDPSGTLAASYGAVGIPTTFVIDPTGMIVYRFIGKLRGPDLASVLDDLLKEMGST